MQPQAARTRDIQYMKSTKHTKTITEPKPNQKEQLQFVPFNKQTLL